MDSFIDFDVVISSNYIQHNSDFDFFEHLEKLTLGSVINSGTQPPVLCMHRDFVWEGLDVYKK